MTDDLTINAIKAWNARNRATYSEIRVTPLTNTIGAEIEGVNLGGEISDGQMSEIRRALAENLVIVFRDQDMSNAQHKAFGMRFGELHLHPANLARGAENPEIVELRADANSKYAIGEGWHADVTCDECPPKASVLYITEMPESGCGGDTQFANMHLAYDLLSDSMKQFLDGKTATHDGGFLATLYGFPTPPGGYPKNDHPVVTRHPDTGRKVLWVNRAFTTRILELSKDESDAVLEMLFRKVETIPSLSCRISWRANTVVMWDNRATQHHAVWDYAPFTRYGRRVTVLGDRPHA